MDVKSTFLNGFLKEELYMMQPEGFVHPKGANKMCKQLHRGLSLKNSFQTLVYAFQKILHHFQSAICHSHILIRKAVVLPLTFL